MNYATVLRFGHPIHAAIDEVERTIAANLAADPHFYDDPNATPEMGSAAFFIDPRVWTRTEPYRGAAINGSNVWLNGSNTVYRAVYR